MCVSVVTVAVEKASILTSKIVVRLLSSFFFFVWYCCCCRCCCNSFSGFILFFTCVCSFAYSSFSKHQYQPNIEKKPWALLSCLEFAFPIGFRCVQFFLVRVWVITKHLREHQKKILNKKKRTPNIAFARVSLIISRKFDCRRDSDCCLRNHYRRRSIAKADASIF